jgi:hypothetical protein
MMMRAIKAFVYGNRKLEPGDTFELVNEHGDADAHRHVLLGGQLAEDVMNGVAPSELPKRHDKRGRYKRRDLRAEE